MKPFKMIVPNKDCALEFKRKIKQCFKDATFHSDKYLEDAKYVYFDNDIVEVDFVEVDFVDLDYNKYQKDVLPERFFSDVMKELDDILAKNKSTDDSQEFHNTIKIGDPILYLGQDHTWYYDIFRGVIGNLLIGMMGNHSQIAPFKENEICANTNDTPTPSFSIEHNTISKHY